MMKTARFQTPARLLIATFGLAVIALGVGSIPSAEAGGLRNCVEITGKTSGRVGCFELVWVDGVQRRMTFSNQGFDGATPKALDAFYVLAPAVGRRAGLPAQHLPARPRRSRRARRQPWRLQRQAPGLLRRLQRSGHRERGLRSFLDVGRRSRGAAAGGVRRRPSPDIGRSDRVCGRRGTRRADQPRPRCRDRRDPERPLTPHRRTPPLDRAAQAPSRRPLTTKGPYR